MTENQRDNFLTHIANNIRKTAKEKGVGLKDLATSAGISEQGLQLLLKTGNIKLPVLYDIAIALNVELSHLLGDYCKNVDSENLEVTKMRELLSVLLKKAQ